MSAPAPNADGGMPRRRVVGAVPHGGGAEDDDPPPLLSPRPVSPQHAPQAGPAAVVRPNAAAPAPSGKPGAVSGIVRGNVAVDSVERRFRGFQLLGVLIPPVLVLGAVRGGSGGRDASLYAIVIEAAAMAVLGVLLVLRRRQDSVLGALARSAMAMMPRRRRAAGGPPRTGPAPRYSTVVTRFHIDELSGGRHECILRGRLKEGRLNSGDPVRVLGRRRRGGEIVVRRVAVLGSAGGIPLAWIERSRRGDFALAHRADRVALGTAALLAAGLAAVWLPRLI